MVKALPARVLRLLPASPARASVAGGRVILLLDAGDLLDLNLDLQRRAGSCR